jgi:hypothetical protein
MQKIYRIKLVPEERQQLEELTRSTKPVAANKVTKAHALLLADESDQGVAWSDPDIMAATGISAATLSRLRQRTCEVGPLEALHRKPQEIPSRPRRLTGEVEARASAIACSEPPEGHKRWTMQLIANELVNLEVIDSVSDEAVRLMLKKTRSSPG